VRRKKSQERRIAQERIEILFDMAEKEAMKKNWERANRYVELARTVSTRYNVTPRPELRRRFCRGCGTFLLPSVTARVRLGGGRVAYTCLKCGRISRYPHVREIRARRQRRERGIGGTRETDDKAGVESP
jgi:ribonuclease P protein subunit RPR2